MTSLLALSFAFLLVLNLFTVLRFWQDKQRAMAGERRIAEADLLGLAIIGGSPGAAACQTNVQAQDAQAALFRPTSF